MEFAVFGGHYLDDVVLGCNLVDDDSNTGEHGPPGHQHGRIDIHEVVQQPQGPIGFAL